MKITECYGIVVGVVVVVFVGQKYCGDSGLGLPLQYLLNSGWLLAVRKTRVKAIHKHSVTGFTGKRVTKWSLFFDESANEFEGQGVLRRFMIG